MHDNKLKYLSAFIFSAFFLIIQLLTLSHYGMNWDSPIRFLRGQAYLQLFLTGKKTFGFQRNLSPMVIHDKERISRFDPLQGEGNIQINLPKQPLYLKQFQDLQKEKGQRISFYEDDFYSAAAFLADDHGHPPLPDILAAGSNRIFYQWLGLLDDVHAYNLMICSFAAAGVFIVFVFTFELLSSLGISLFLTVAGASLSAISLGAYPLYFSDSHFNLKEPLVACFYTGAIWTFWKWFMTNRKRWFAGFTAFVAASLGTKWNIVLLPLVLVPWLIFQIKTKDFKKWFEIRKILFCLVIFFVSCFVFIIIIWPHMWSDPLGKLYQTVLYYKDATFQTDPYGQPLGYRSFFGINLYPMFLILVESPEILLLLAGLGLIRLVKSSESRPVALLLVLWFLIPVAKMMYPGVWFYNGMRQEIEAVPAMAVLAGIGFAFISSVILRLQPKYLISRKEILRSAQNDNKLKIMIVILIFFTILILLIYPIIRLFPNENLYFNSFVGGVKGAFQKNLISPKTNYGNVYKQAADWLNIHAGKNAKFAILSGNEFALSPTYLRPDISISPYNFSGLSQNGEYAVEAFDPSEGGYFAYKYLYRFLKPLYTIYAGGAPILKIFQNKPENSLVDMKGEITTKDFSIRSTQSPLGLQIYIDIGKTVRVTRIFDESSSKKCQAVFFEHGDEAISFYDQNMARTAFITHAEKTFLGNNTVMFSFPGIPSRFIAIEPVNSNSCFSGGKITEISYLP